MINLAIFFPCSALHLTVVFTLDHDRLVGHILFNNRRYTLLFDCAYLKCDKEGTVECHYNAVQYCKILYE